MANTGQGNHPLISSWFTPKYNYPHNSLHLLRRMVGIEVDTADNTVWADFFFEAAGGAAAITGTITTNQAAQALLAAGSESFTGVVTLNQAAQTLAATGSIPIPVTGTVTTDQAAQTLLAAGTETFAGTIATDQAGQALASVGKEDFLATATMAQGAQTMDAAGDNGEAIAITGDILTDQMAKDMLADGTVADAVIPVPVPDRYQRQPPVFLIGFSRNIKQRRRRRGEASHVQAQHSMSAVGTVTEMIRGEAVLECKAQQITAIGRKSTRARDEKAIRELIDLEVA